MIRIAGQTLSPKKRLRFALTPIRGIGKNNVKDLISGLYDLLKSNSESDFDYTKEAFFDLKLGDLNESVLVSLRNYIEQNFLVEADLRRKVLQDIKRMVDLGSYRGMRHKLGLPTRGQGTRSNSRTRRGNQRRSGGSGKVKSK